jgi:hypothetical protein
MNYWSDRDAKEREQRSTLRSDAENGTREDADDGVDLATKRWEGP